MLRFLGGAGSTERVGLTAQTPEVALIPLVRLVSASCHLWHIALDGGRNDSVGFRLFGAIRSSTTPQFYPAHPLGMHPSTSLVADPSRRKTVLSTIPPIALLGFTQFGIHRATSIIPYVYFELVAKLLRSGRIGLCLYTSRLGALL